MIIITISVPTIFAVACLNGGRYVNTENVYVKTYIVQISINIDSLLTRAYVSENQNG